MSSISLSALQSKHKSTLILMCFCSVSLCLRLFFISYPNLLAEEAYYWNYAQHLDWSYLDHPPMVACLIKLSTAVFGLNEWGVRFPALISWGIASYYSYQWCELIQRGTGLSALFLLSTLPFFFLYSLVMTPDMLLVACWSASLYYLYKALYSHQASAWYWAGIAVGMGLLAKYTMILIPLATGLYLLTQPKQRHWFLRKEPYLALIIILLLFSPVIYWNKTHAWVSFAFQSTRRFNGTFHFSLPELSGLLFCFLTPMGLIGFYQLLQTRGYPTLLPRATKDMMVYFTAVPLAVFFLFSLTREIKFNWIGPSLLGLLPWLALLMQTQERAFNRWRHTANLLLICYAIGLGCITFGQPNILNRMLFSKMIAWDNLTAQLRHIAHQAQLSYKEEPILIPLDSYSIASEFSFYQMKQRSHHPESQSVPILGAMPFGYPSLMFQYWYPYPSLHDKLVIVVGKTEYSLRPQAYITPLTPIQSVWGLSQGSKVPVRQYYYQVARMNYPSR